MKFSTFTIKLILVLASIVCAALSGAAQTTDSGAEVVQRSQKDGIAIEFSVRKDEAPKSDSKTSLTNVAVKLRFTDAVSDNAVAGARPRVWVSLGKGETKLSEEECKNKIKSFASGQLATKADVDLNGFRVVTLNDDKTIAFINPLIAFSRTKLESIIELPGKGADWVLSNDKEWLFITIPDRSMIAVVNVAKRKLFTTLDTGAGSKPFRITMQPDGRYAWIGLDNSSNVLAIDVESKKLAAAVGVGNGLHQIAASTDSRFIAVTNSADDSVTLIDAKLLNKSATIKTDKTPVAIAYGAEAKRFYAASINGTTLTAIDPEAGIAAASISVKRGIVAIKFDPENRFAVAVNQIESKVYILDSASNSIIGEGSVVSDPDQITFTNRFAYVRGLGSEKFSLLELSALRQGKISSTNIQAGAQPPSAEPNKINVAAMIAPTPDGSSVVIANAPDRVIHFYTEGLMASSGTLDNYKRFPLAVMILDESLAEKSAGIYAANVKFSRGGIYDVAMLTEQPRLMSCFKLKVDAPASEAEAKMKILLEPLFLNETLKTASAAKLRFKLTNSKDKQPVKGLRDVRALLLEPPGAWTQKQWAQEIEPGIYEITQTFPHVGSYLMMVSVTSLGSLFADQKPIKVEIKE